MGTSGSQAVDDKLKQLLSTLNAPPRTTAPITEVVHDQDVLAQELMVNKFPHLGTLSFLKPPVNRDFHDDAWKGRKAITLERLSTDKIIEVGTSVFTNLKVNISLKDAAALMVLAFNLRLKDRSSYLFRDEIPEDWETSEDMSLDQVHDRKFLSTTAVPVPPTYHSYDSYEIAHGLCFIAASTLRMFTKTADNYEKAFHHILDGYKNFYGLAIPISNIRLGAMVTPRLANTYSALEILKSTLFRLLWSANATIENTSVKIFLYHNHLANTGLHIVSLFLQCCEVLHVSPSELIKPLYSNRRKEILADLATLSMDLPSSNQDQHKRKMWMYARIFDEIFFATLQTKKCADLVCIFAHVLQKMDAPNASGIFKIASLERRSENLKQI